MEEIKSNSPNSETIHLHVNQSNETKQLSELLKQNSKPDFSFCNISFTKIPISAIFAAYAFFIVWILYERPHVEHIWTIVDGNLILLIVLFWSIVESVRKYPLVIALVINVFLFGSDIAVACNHRFIYNSSFWLTCVSALFRPVVCFILYCKLNSVCGYANEQDIEVGDEIKPEQQIETDSNLKSKSKTEKQLDFSDDPINAEMNSCLTKMSINFIFWLYFTITISFLILTVIENSGKLNNSKMLFLGSNALLYVILVLLLFREFKSEALALGAIAINLFAILADFNALDYFDFDYTRYSFWILIFCLTTRPITTIALHRHSTDYRKLIGNNKSAILKQIEENLNIDGIK